MRRAPMVRVAAAAAASFMQRRRQGCGVARAACAVFFVLKSSAGKKVSGALLCRVRGV